MKLPVLTINKLYHVGDMTSQDKESYSYEGDGLSVSVTPISWQKIAKINSNKIFGFSKADACFVDVLKIKEDPMLYGFILEWACDANLLEQKSFWSYPVFDENDQVQYFNAMTKEDALLELDMFDYGEFNKEDSIKEIKVPVLTSQGSDRSVRYPHNCDAFDMAVYFWVEDYVKQNYDISGLWWEEDYKVEQFSAPRGLIFPQDIASFNKKREYFSKLPGEEYLLHRLRKESHPYFIEDIEMTNRHYCL